MLPSQQGASVRPSSPITSRPSRRRDVAFPRFLFYTSSRGSALIRSPGGRGRRAIRAACCCGEEGELPGRLIGPDERFIDVLISSLYVDQAAGVTGTAAVEGGLVALWTAPPLMTTQTLERASPGGRIKAPPPAHSVAALPAGAKTRLRTDSFRRQRVCSDCLSVIPIQLPTGYKVNLNTTSAAITVTQIIWIEPDPSEKKVFCFMAGV